MWTYFAFIIAATIVSAERKDCVACIDGFCYDKPALPGEEGFDRAIDMTKNMLYLTQKYKGKISACDLDTEVCTDTYLSHQISKLTVDQSTGDIYALGDYGRNIYKLDLVNDTQTHVLRTEASALFFKDKLYYSRSRRGIYTFVDGQSAVIGPTEEYYIGEFIVDKHDHIYFSDVDESIKWLNKGEVMLTDLDQERLFVMTVDKDGSAMFYDTITHVLYRVSYGKRTDVGAFKDDIFVSLLFDRDNNIVYLNKALFTKVVYLKREGNRTCSVNRQNEIATIDEFSKQSSDNGVVSEDEGSGLASSASAEYYSGWIVLSVMVIISYI